MFIFTNTSPTLPSPTPPTLSIYLHHPSPSLSLSTGQRVGKTADWRTDGWYHTQVRPPKIGHLRHHCANLPLCLMNFLPLPHQDDLLLNRRINPPDPVHVQILLSQMSWWLHVMVIGHTCTLLICSTRTISSDGGFNMSRGKLKTSAQFTSQWWPEPNILGRKVKACSISAPGGNMGLGSDRTYWPLLDRFWTLPWCVTGISTADWDTSLSGIQANGYNYIFLFTDLTRIFLRRTKKNKKARIWIPLWAV